MSTVKKLESSISEVELQGLRSVPNRPIEEVRIREDENLSTQVESGVPVFEVFACEKITGEFGVKDGALLFHIYKNDRKKVYDQFIEALEGTRPGSKEESEIFRKGNAAMVEIPWWDNTETVLAEEAKAQYKFLDNRIGYAQEVDSWTVMFPEPTAPGATSKMYLQGFLTRVDARLGAK
jgi:hypothetical protein